MKKPYAESTLRRKNKETGIEEDKIDTLIDYLTACAEFYQIVELKYVWPAIQKACKKIGVTKADYDKLIPIFERDEAVMNTSFALSPISQFYYDGPDDLLLVNPYIHIGTNYECDLDEYDRCRLSGEEYNGPEPDLVDPERFYTLDEMRAGKGVYMPADLIEYADPSYIEETPQVEAMRKFLMGLEIIGTTDDTHTVVDAGDVEVVDTDEVGREQTIDPAAKSRSIADAVIREMCDIIKDFTVSPTDAIKYTLKVMVRFGYRIDGFDQTQKLMDLFTDLSNNTRMPSNGGYTPNEVMRKMGRGSGSGIAGGFPQSIDFGPGIMDSIRNGELDGIELRRAIIENEQFPLELKAELLKAVDKAMRQERNVDKPANQKPGRNDPCPCGSGKKYKNCCGKLN